MDNNTVSPPLLTQNSGRRPVDTVRDPRIVRLWTKYEEADLPVPKFKVPAPTDDLGIPAFSLREQGCCQKLQTHPLSLIFGMLDDYRRPK